MDEGRTGELLADRYRLDGILGHGAMADVYRAVDQRLDRVVAVKVFELTDDEVGRRRFAEEARILARLDDPGLVTALDTGTGDGCAYLVMELVDGESLRQALDRGVLPPADVARLGAQLAQTLAHVHERGVIHRDLKPSNVLLGADGRPRIADFGISLLADATRVTRTGQLMGTAGYLAPEQVLGEQVGPAADVYALGLVLLECCTGYHEYQGTEVEAALARLHRPPRIPDGVPEALATVLRSMTATEPEHRPDAATCARRLVRADRELHAVAALSGEAAEATTPIALTAPARRPWLPALALGMAALTGLAATSLLLVEHGYEPIGGPDVPAASSSARPANPGDGATPKDGTGRDAVTPGGPVLVRDTGAVTPGTVVAEAPITPPGHSSSGTADPSGQLNPTDPAGPGGSTGSTGSTGSNGTGNPQPTDHPTPAPTTGPANAQAGDQNARPTTSRSHPRGDGT